MATPVLYIRGMPTPGSAEWLDRSLVEDSAKLLELSDKSWQELVARLSGFTGFLDESSCKELVSAEIADPNLAKSIARVINSAIRPPFAFADDPVPFFINSLRKWHKKHSGDGESAIPLTIEQLQQICERVSLLSGSLPALYRQRKAERLQSSTGQPLESFELICDLRPIFDADRRQIEGLIPLTHLKLVAEASSGLPTSFEVVLSMSNLHALHEATEKAIRKLECLSDFSDSSEIPIPRIKLTQISEDK